MKYLGAILIVGVLGSWILTLALERIDEFQADVQAQQQERLP